MDRKTISLQATLFITAFLFLSFASFAGNIISPWRAAPTITKSGDSFIILFNSINYTDIDSIALVGPYNRVNLSIDSVAIGRFEYDTYTKSAVNIKIQVKVPEAAPEEIYNLVVYSDSQMDISLKSVKVVREFDPAHCFIHISDPHISRQWVGSAEDGYAKELELFDRFVEVANIIAPDFVIVTGDIIHHYTLFDADSTGWGKNKAYDSAERPLAEEKFKNYYDGAKGFSGIHGVNAAVFSLPGNHDSYGVSRTDHFAMASQWNQFCGKRVYGFSYAGTRVIVADDYLGDPVTDIPDSSPMAGLQGAILTSFLEEEGEGDFRIMAQHRPHRIDTSFLDRYKINLLLNGHRHNPFEEYVGLTPTLSIRPGTVCRSGEIKNWKETLGFFRIFYINEDTLEFTPALRFCKNPTVPYQELEINLTLGFEKLNNGTTHSNEAIIHNAFDIDLPKCKIRYVMKKDDYTVSGGIIQQVIQTDSLTIVDVYTTVQSNSSKKVRISPTE